MTGIGRTHATSGNRVVDVRVLATCELRWDFPEEERMMQYNRDKHFPQLRNQGYQSSRRTKQQLVNSTCTQTTNTCKPTRTRGCQSLHYYEQG